MSAMQNIRPTNGLGVAGFVVSLLSAFTCGFTSPIGLLLSLFALRRAPRGFAWAGTILGGLGTAALASVGYTFYSAADMAYRSGVEAETREVLSAAEAIINTHRLETNQLPGGIEGNKLIVEMEDGWGTALRYEETDDAENFTIRSAGADRQFNTPDDCTKGESSHPVKIGEDHPLPELELPEIDSN